MSGSRALPAQMALMKAKNWTNSRKRPEMVSVKGDGIGDAKWQTCTEKWPLPRKGQTSADSAGKTVLTGSKMCIAVLTV